MSKIVLDAVGGDHAPKEAVAGVALALAKGFLRPDQIILTGPKSIVGDALAAANLPVGEFEVVDAPDVLTCADSPTDAMRRKPRNSINVGIQLVKEGRASGFVSAGSTGTVVASATLSLRCLEGIRRPAIAAIIQGEKNPFLVLDIGANPQPKPLHLAQYALMGAAYYEVALGVKQPRVGVLNIGSEELKGNPLVREARALMKQMPINFQGNCEGTDVFHGDFQVIVTDGFTGNVLLKVSEGVGEYLIRHIAGVMQKSPIEPKLQKQVLGETLARIDYSEYGGALLLGIEGVVTICHGRSHEPAFANALRFAMRAIDGQCNQHIVDAVRQVPQLVTGDEASSAATVPSMADPKQEPR